MKTDVLTTTVQFLAVADSVRIVFQYSLCHKKECLVYRQRLHLIAEFSLNWPLGSYQYNSMNTTLYNSSTPCQRFSMFRH